MPLSVNTNRTKWSPSGWPVRSIVGVGEGENFIASDIPAILEHTRDFYALEDGEMAVLTREDVRLMKTDGEPVEREPFRVDWDIVKAEKGGYRSLHVEGDPRTAPGDPGYPGRPDPGRTSRISPGKSPSLRKRSGRSNASILLPVVRRITPDWSANTSSRSWCASRWRWMSPPNTAIEIRFSRRARWWW